MAQDFSAWTLTDFQAMDAQRAFLSQPTPEQIAVEQTAAQVAFQTQIVQTQTDLQKYGITFLGTETDFLNLYTQYINGDPIMSDIFGDLDSRNVAIAYQYQIGNTVQAFVNFVLKYEG